MRKPPVLPLRYFWIFVVVALCAGWFATKKISFAVDLLDILPKLPEIEGLRTYEKHFIGRDQLMVGVENEDPQKSEEAAKSLALFLGEKKDFVSNVRWRPWSEDAGKDAAELAAWLIANSEPTRVSEMLKGVDPAVSSDTMQESLETMASTLDVMEVERLSADPLGFLNALPLAKLMTQGEKTEFRSADGTLRLLYVTWKDAPNGYHELDEWVGKVEGAIAEWSKANPPLAEGLTFYYSGDPAFRSEISMRMEEDMSGSFIIPNLGVLLVFWLIFRRVMAMAGIFIMLLSVLALTQFAGAMTFGSLNVMSMGFAAILVGLVADYAVILFQEARTARAPDGPTVLRASGNSIIWGSLCTAAVFSMLNFSSLPGLGQLGSLVAMGVVIGAVSMLLVFSPVAAWMGRKDHAHKEASNRPYHKAPFRLGLGIVSAALGVLIFSGGPPSLDSSFESIRLKGTRAYSDTMHITEKLDDGSGNFIYLVVTGPEQEMPARIAALIERCEQLEKTGELHSHVIPDFFWPEERKWKANLPLLAGLEKNLATWKAQAAEAGFTEEAMALTENLVGHWKEYAASGEAVPTPHTNFARGVMRQLTNVNGDSSAVVAAVRTNLPHEAGWQAVVDRKQQVVNQLNDLPGVMSAEWKLLGPSLEKLINHDIRVVYPLAGVALLICLFLAFRNVKDVLLGLAGLATVFVILMGLMKAIGLATEHWHSPDSSTWQFFHVLGHWNLLNITAVPLLIGTGIDNLIHFILALRRSGKNYRHMRGGVGKALLFCACSNAIGFGSLGFSSHPGLRSMGLVCSAGILIVFFVSRWIIPHWYHWIHRKELDQSPQTAEASGH